MKFTVREQIVAMMQDAGYDTFTACEEADRILREFRQSGRLQSRCFVKGGGAFTINRKRTQRAAFGLLSAPYSLTRTNLMHIKSREALRGTRNPNAALMPQDVLTIRQRYAAGATQRELCRVYGVSITTISRIIHFETWGWLTDESAVSPNAPQTAPLAEVDPAAVAASAERLQQLLTQEPAEPEGNFPPVELSKPIE